VAYAADSAMWPVPYFVPLVRFQRIYEAERRRLEALEK
jgi:hypothetical protein